MQKKFLKKCTHPEIDYKNLHLDPLLRHPHEQMKGLWLVLSQEIYFHVSLGCHNFT